MPDDKSDAGQKQPAPTTQPPAPEADDAAQRLLADAAQGGDDDSDDGPALDPKAKAKLDKANREARNLRQRLKELEPLAARLKELEDKDKTEAQRLADQVAELQTQLVEHRVREVRTAAAAAAGLPAEMAQFISADDPDEAKAQAKALAEWRKAETSPPDLRQGPRQAPPTAVTGDQLLRRMAGRQ